MASDWRIVDEPLARECVPRVRTGAAPIRPPARARRSMPPGTRCTPTRPVRLASRRGRTSMRAGSRRRPGGVRAACWTSAAATVRCCAPSRAHWPDARVAGLRSVAGEHRAGFWRRPPAVDGNGEQSARRCQRRSRDRRQRHRAHHRSDGLPDCPARGAPTDGLLVIVCPDGGRPGLDLLFVDHVFSFSREHLGTLLSRAGLQRLGASRRRARWARSRWPSADAVMPPR